jgi:hypothetical protein
LILFASCSRFNVPGSEVKEKDGLSKNVESGTLNFEPNSKLLLEN